MVCIAAHSPPGGRLVRADGTVERGFEAVRDAFAEGQAQDEGGAQLCVYQHGKRVVDVWAGTDKLKSRPIRRHDHDFMSCTKAVTAVLRAHARPARPDRL